MPQPTRSLRHAIRLLLPSSFLFAVQIQAQAPPGCRAPEYRQFDFWVGDWTVATPQGKPAGTSHIERILGGCVLQEHWSSSNGGDGTSLNMWNAADRKWHQVWMDAGGNLLELAGHLEGASMILTGEHPTPGEQGGTTVERITWTPLQAGTVRQHWESSTDGGATWTTSFDGIYAPKP